MVVRCHMWCHPIGNVIDFAINYLSFQPLWTKKSGVLVKKQWCGFISKQNNFVFAKCWNEHKIWNGVEWTHRKQPYNHSRHTHTHTHTNTHTKMSQKISKSSNIFLRAAWDTEQSMSWHWRSKRAFPCGTWSGQWSRNKCQEANRKWKPTQSLVVQSSLGSYGIQLLYFWDEKVPQAMQHPQVLMEFFFMHERSKVWRKDNNKKIEIKMTNTSSSDTWMLWFWCCLIVLCFSKKCILQTQIISYVKVSWWSC